MDEKKLIQACIKEDKSAQKALYDLFSAKMYFVCLRYARHEAEAQDILQDAFIKVFDKLDSFRFNGSFEGWVRRIMVNTALNYCRKSTYKYENIGIEDYQDKVVNSKAISRLSEQELLGIIQQLPDGYRMVFNLYIIEGYSHKEIAEMLSISENTSRSQLAKARKWVQNVLEKLKTSNNV
ncbi:MAG: RNA polymerase subunit sigma-24 [Flavobacteriales bacterium]|nr:RNA polymerase subunit sigma-24 [Flavobacteriales bacterium]|tara:strand:+ start:6613 stop:7152 length:540 start_codon:yes stop_codon:yes gene_type:complete